MMTPLEDLTRAHLELGGLEARLIHLAGSKGKGTTAHLIAAGLQAIGRRVGLFCSPHITHPRELIQVQGESPSIEAFEDLVQRVQTLGHDFSDFENWTLAALLHFKEQNCDNVILECGWGGAKDATNLVPRKDLCILTHIELEHVGILGDTLEEITREKLGICQSGVPLLTPRQQKPEVLKVLEGHEPLWVDPVSLGTHHPESAGLALAALEALEGPLSDEIKNTLKFVSIPGRFERRKWGQKDLILEVAHTPDSVAYAINRIETTLKEEGLSPDQILWGVHFLKDKSPTLPDLFEGKKHVWIPLDDPRAGSCPKDWKELDLNTFLEQEAPVLVLLGSFRLYAAFTKLA